MRHRLIALLTALALSACTTVETKITHSAPGEGTATLEGVAAADVTGGVTGDAAAAAGDAAGGGASVTTTTAKPVAATGALVPKAGGQGATDQGVTATAIRIGTYNSYSGTFRIVGEPILRAMQAALKDINDAGGVNGRKIELVTCEADALSNEQALSCAKRLVEQDKVFAVLNPIGMDLGNVAALPYLQSKGIPVINAASLSDTDGALTPLRWYFALSTEVELKLAIDFAKRLGKKRLGIASTNLEVSRAAMKRWRPALAAAGFEVVWEKELDPYATNAQADQIATEWRLADVEIIIPVFANPLLAVPAAKRQGFTDFVYFHPSLNGQGKWSDLNPQICGPACTEIPVYTDTGGYLHPKSAGTSPEFQQMRRALDRYYPDRTFEDFLVIVPYAGVQIFADAVKAMGAN